MPRFDFHCRKCGASFEATMGFGSKTMPACSQCGSKRTEKQLTVPGIVFKGTGFYKTDSRAAPTAKETKETKATEATKEPQKVENEKPAPKTPSTDATKDKK